MLLRIFVISCLGISVLKCFDYDGMYLAEDEDNNNLEYSDESNEMALAARSSSLQSSGFLRIIQCLRSTADELMQNIDQLEKEAKRVAGESSSPTTKPLGSSSSAAKRPDIEDECESISNDTNSNSLPPYGVTPIEFPNDKPSNSDNPCIEAQEKLKNWNKQHMVKCRDKLDKPKTKWSPEVKINVEPFKKRTIRVRTNGINKKAKNVSNGESWTDWSSWSPCSVSCGLGRQVRYRKCSGNGCAADIEMDEQECVQPNCNSALSKGSNLYKVFNML